MPQHPAAALAVLLAVLPLAFPSNASAEPRPIAARVMGMHAGRVVVAADSGTLVPGARLAFHERGREVARGEIAAVLDGVLASVRIDAGSLARVRKHERLAIFLEPPPAPPAPARATRLKVGLPDGARAYRLLACARGSIRAPAGLAVRSLGDGAFEMTRTDSTTAPWPDTTEVRLFADAADEEIAFERGDVGVALFWPGEPSARLRAGPAGRAALTGRRADGVGCPVLVHPASRGAVEALGAGALAELPDCGAPR